MRPSLEAIYRHTIELFRTDRRIVAAWEFGSILANAKACGMVLPGPLGLLFDWLATMLAPSKMPPPKADVRRQEP